ncbi:MAG: alpha-glucan family phosphorylase [Alphaproteobacteria bacterium]|nr:MAG: alpha-glucan family phosphorylase [Alphaproteobacteria bacterium]
MPSGSLPPLPKRLGVLKALALDLFWTWSHTGDTVWRQLDADVWERTRNPWFVLQNLGAARLKALAKDTAFLADLDTLVEERRQYLERPSWFAGLSDDSPKPGGIAYFSMEFGLGEALPLYAGGLGILAGDYLKAASDLGLPVTGIGLLYQEGYFRQYIDGRGRQRETYPYNEPASLPIEPVLDADGNRLSLSLELPGRSLMLRVWRATVGRVSLYLLDSNHLMNSAADRGITAKLYGGGSEVRFLQELVLGVGGWRVIEALGLDIDICHLNEGHAAFVVLARARAAMEKQGLGFWEALWATRAGNIFTTHTPVSAGFDRFSPGKLPVPAHFIGDYLERYGVQPEQILALGRQSDDPDEPFNMSSLALRGSAHINAVSALHEKVSQQLFAPLYPRWPVHEVPVGHVTNGIHTPSWDSRAADRLWTDHCGRERWRDTGTDPSGAIAGLGDTCLWHFRAEQRAELIGHARGRLARQLAIRSVDTGDTDVGTVLDPNVLTVGFARRFATYKRPNLLLKDPERLVRLLTNPDRPMQLIVAGKAHPDDRDGQAMVSEWLAFVNRPDVRRHAVFLEDYDISLAQELVAGVDLWLNTPRPPMEACGTSGMKVLVNGGLNLSVPDGWWAEAGRADAGWVLGDGSAGSDEADAAALFDMLEQDVIPTFYDRDENGIPAGWTGRMRTSMAELAPAFSASRMVRDYYDRLYRPAVAMYAGRTADAASKARALNRWQEKLADHWGQIHFGDTDVVTNESGHHFRTRLFFGEIEQDAVAVQLYASPTDSLPPFVQAMQPAPDQPGDGLGYVYGLTAPLERPAEAYTVRVVPHHADTAIPAEIQLIRWQH